MMYVDYHDADECMYVAIKSGIRDSGNLTNMHLLSMKESGLQYEGLKWM